jgi:hypothetical protein
MKTTRIAILAAAMAGAAVGLSGPASAEPLSGAYTATMLDGGGAYKRGSTTTWTLTPCGPDCTHVNTGAGTPSDLHLQGNTWNGPFGVSDTGDVSCTATLDNNSLVLTSHCPGHPDMVIGLTKNG